MGRGKSSRQIDRICKTCGMSFIAHNAKAVYCSHRCRDIGYRVNNGIPCNTNTKPYIKTCKVCGKAYETYRDAVGTCSPECAIEWHKYRGRQEEKSTRECPICGCLFTISGSSSQATCGDRVCMAAYKKQRHEERNIKWQQKRIKRAKKEHDDERKCIICGRSFMCYTNETKKTCGHECSLILARMNRCRRDKRIPKEQRIDSISLKRLYERDKGICYICGKKCDWKNWRTSDSGHQYPGDRYPTVEHVIPVSLGGADAWENVRLACWKCNSEKGASTGDLQLMLGDFAKPILKTGAKKTAQYSLDGELIKIWDSTAAIRRELGLNDTYIQHACRRWKTNTGNAYGYHWEYVTDGWCAE